MAKNITIDDQFGDESTGLMPTYSPAAGNWKQGATCNACQLQPNASLAFDHTWHDSTYDPIRRPGVDAITLFFEGTAIYVYCIQGNLMPFNANAVVETRMNLSYILDDEHVGSYYYAPNNESVGFAYNVPVYVNETLTNAPHALTIQSYAVNLFDYAVYTVPDDDATTSGTSPSGSGGPSASRVSSVIPNSVDPTSSLGSKSGTTAIRKSRGAIIGCAVGLIGQLMLRSQMV